LWIGALVLGLSICAGAGLFAGIIGVAPENAAFIYPVIIVVTVATFAAIWIKIRRSHRRRLDQKLAEIAQEVRKSRRPD
jgi:hypothetical protein